MYTECVKTRNLHCGNLRADNIVFPGLEDMIKLMSGVIIDKPVCLCDRESRTWTTNELWCMLIPTHYTRRHRFSIVGTDSLVDIVRISNGDAVAR
jgi:hypothetical protein